MLFFHNTVTALSWLGYMMAMAGCVAYSHSKQSSRPSWSWPRQTLSTSVSVLGTQSKTAILRIRSMPSMKSMAYLPLKAKIPDGDFTILALSPEEAQHVKNVDCRIKVDLSKWKDNLHR